MEPKSSLQDSQVPATCPYTEPAQSSPSNNNKLVIKCKLIKKKGATDDAVYDVANVAYI